MCELVVVVALVPLTVVGNRPQRAREPEPRDLEQLRFAVDLLRETFMVAERGYLFNDLRDDVELAE